MQMNRGEEMTEDATFVFIRPYVKVFFFDNIWRDKAARYLWRGRAGGERYRRRSEREREIGRPDRSDEIRAQTKRGSTCVFQWEIKGQREEKRQRNYRDIGDYIKD